MLPGGGFNPWGLSRYAYVAGNPETHIDADGHCWPLCTILIGAVVGAVMGGGGDIVGDLATGHAIDWGQVGKDAAVGALTGPSAGWQVPRRGWRRTRRSMRRPAPGGRSSTTPSITNP